MSFEEIINRVMNRIGELEKSLDELKKEIEELRKRVVEGKVDQKTVEKKASDLMKRLKSIEEEIRRIDNDPELITETLRYALDYMKNYMQDSYQLFAEAIIRACEIYKKNEFRNAVVFINGGLNALGVRTGVENLSEVQKHADALKNRSALPTMLIDYVDAIKSAEIYAVTEGIVADGIYGYSYAVLTLEEIYPYVDAETKKVFDFIRMWNPNLMTKKFYIIKPRFKYNKPEKIFYLNGEPVLAIKDGKVYYPRFVHEGSGEGKVLRMYIPVERLFEETDGRIKISAIIRLWSGAEVKYDLLEINVKFRGKHGEVLESQFKFLKEVVRKVLEEVKDERYRKKLSDTVAEKGSRNWMLVSISVNGKPIDSSLDIVARSFSKALGDPKKKQLEYFRKYRSSLILPVERAKKFEEVFGNQEVRVVSRIYAEEMYSKSRRLRSELGLVYDRKDEAIPEVDGYGWIVKGRINTFNHVIFSEDPFTVLVLEFHNKVYNYVIPSKNGQEFIIINRHHGGEGKYIFRIKLNLDESIEFVHKIP